MIIEVCIDSVESAINAEAGGADRLELCAALEIGGITPGPGLIESVIANVTIPVNVMIRPRGGDFLYSDAEFEVMRRDIDFSREAGAAGIVLGILMPDGSIDFDRTAYLIEYAAPMPVTFHRAFDMTADPFQAVEDIISAGTARILTSGQGITASDGAVLIGELVKLADDRIIIMPGSGLNEENISEIARITGASEFHLTGRIVTESGMLFRRPEVSLGNPAMRDEEYLLKIADTERVAKIKKLLSIN
jgi:copper homeostasis protein